MEDDDSNRTVTKLLVDDASDFMFHAAYLTYTKAWNENLAEEVRLQLNEALQSLLQNKDYSTYYRQISQFRKTGSSIYSRRTQFKAKKKRAWRKSEAKMRRISRHKK